MDRLGIPYPEPVAVRGGLKRKRMIVQRERNRLIACLAGLGLAATGLSAGGAEPDPPKASDTRHATHPSLRAVELRTSLAQGGRTFGATSPRVLGFLHTMHAQAHLLRAMALNFIEANRDSDVDASDYLREARRISGVLKSIDERTGIVHPGVVIMADVRLGWATGAIDKADRTRMSLLMIATGLVARTGVADRMEASVVVRGASDGVPDPDGPEVQGGYGFPEVDFLVPQIFQSVQDDDADFQNDIDQAIRDGLIEAEAVEAVKFAIGREQAEE